LSVEEIVFIILALTIGITYGVLAQREQFCFSGGIKDLILFKHTRRTASLIIAITTAIISTQIVAYFFDIDLLQSRYYVNINYLFIIIGSLMFGYGMMISDGCSSRHLIKFAQGDRESFYILLSLGLFAFITYTLFTTYSEEIYSNGLVFITNASEVMQLPIIAVAAILLFLLYKSLNKCSNIFQTWDGFFIGLLIAFSWFSTSYIADLLFVDVNTQALSFVYPIGKSVEFFATFFESKVLTFAMLTMVGVVIGAFISSKFNKKYASHISCDHSHQNPPKLPEKLLGGAFMGIGGVLAVGCTVGQGLSGVSTLSLASFLAIASIYVSAYITALYMKKKNALIACFVFDFEDKK
jgi:uncharacterized membrane protein YedE/YeeE